MNTNLLASITSQLTPQMVQKVSSRLGETSEQTQIAVDKAIPTLLSGLLHLSSFTDGPMQLLNLINHDNYGRLLNNLSGLCEEGDTAQNMMTAGQEILYLTFADKLKAVSERIAAASGVTNDSASSLLSLTAPIVVGILGRVRATQGLNATRLTALLLSQKNTIVAQAPAGLAEAFGMSDLTKLGTRPTSVATAVTPAPIRRRAVEPEQDKSTLKKWRWPLLGAVAAGLIYFLVGGDSGKTRSLMINWQPASTPAIVSVTLPGGAALSLEEGSFNHNVAKFLGDLTDTAVPKAFVFDHMNFDFGTTRLTAESEQTVGNLSAILRAYPGVDVRLEGHTDGVGSEANNKRSALERAVAVKEVLIRNGIDATRMSTAGYGQETPVAANNTEDGRIRRLELIVIKK